MAHSIEPILPFDITLATFLIPDICTTLSTTDLLTIRMSQLQKHLEILDNLAACRHSHQHPLQLPQVLIF
jgi:hypothetical protein